MATTEKDGLMTYKDKNGNLYILYPITKADLVVGLDELLAGKDDAGAAAAVQQLLTSHTGNKNNPHGVTAAQAGAVPTSRKVNGKALSGDITLGAGDVDAVPTNDAIVTWVNNALKTLGGSTIDLGAAKIEAGTYTGTGKYTNSDKASLTFSFTPKVVFIGDAGGGGYTITPYVWGGRTFMIFPYNGTLRYCAWAETSGNTLRWFIEGGNAQCAANGSGNLYYYVALG